MSWDNDAQGFLDELARRPAARAPATLGEVWESEWKRGGLDTIFGLGQPMRDAQAELQSAIESAAGKPIADFARDNNVAPLPGALDFDPDQLGALADRLPEEDRKRVAPLKDVRLNASKKAQKIEADADDVAGATYGLSGVGVSFLAGMARQAVDPVNIGAMIATAPFGGSGSVLTRIAIEGAANAAAQAAVEPIIEPKRAELGLEAGWGRAAGNITEAFAGGVALSGLFHGAAWGLRQMRGAKPAAESASVFKSPEGGIAPPEPTKNAPGAVSESPAASVAEAPAGPLSPVREIEHFAPEDLTAAAALAERDHIVDAMAPVQSADAVHAHAAKVEEAAARIENPSARPPPEQRPDLVGERVPAMPSHRVATANNMAIDVQPLVVEASSLTTSSDAGFDVSLQPRQRDREASQMQIRDIASNLDPQRLGYSAEADRGAPIVAADGMVESGNGRVLAIRRVYEQNGASAKAYRDFIAAQGVDVSGFKEPVLVRQRITDLQADERQAFTLGANQTATLTMSAPERALGDARKLDPDVLSLIRDPDNLNAAANRDFIRRFVAGLPQTEQGAIADARGALSAEGLTRIRNAVLARAYGDAPILSRIAEATNDEVKSISNALVAASPIWARLRADIAAGFVRADMDLTPALTEAVSRAADLRSKGVKLSEFLAQQDAFDKLDPAVEDFLRLFYDAKGTRAAGAPRIADALQFYAEQARKVTVEAGLDLGIAPVTARDLQQRAVRRSDGGADQGDLLAGGAAGDGAGGVADRGEVRRSGAGDLGDGEGAGSARRSGENADANIIGDDPRSVLKEFISGQRGVKVEDLHARATKLQPEINRVGTAIADEIGAKFVDPGPKKLAALAEKVVRKQYEDASQITDAARAGLLVDSPTQADAIVAGFAKSFDVIDEGWVRTPLGYSDRKLLIRADDGTIAEIQIIPTPMYAAKRDGGQDLYTKERSLPAGPEKLALQNEQRALYSAASATFAPEWSGIFDRSSAPKLLSNRARQSASDITAAELKTSESSTATHGLPGDRTANADPSASSTAGRQSQLQNVKAIAGNVDLPAAVRKAQSEGFDTTREFWHGTTAAPFTAFKDSPLGQDVLGPAVYLSLHRAGADAYGVGRGGSTLGPFWVRGNIVGEKTPVPWEIGGEKMAPATMLLGKLKSQLVLKRFEPWGEGMSPAEYTRQFWKRRGIDGYTSGGGHEFAIYDPANVRAGYSLPGTEITRIGDASLAADAQRALDDAGGDMEITLLNPDGTTRTLKASEALREVEDDARAAAELQACINGDDGEIPF